MFFNIQSISNDEQKLLLDHYHLLLLLIKHQNHLGNLQTKTIANVVILDIEELFYKYKL